MIADPTFEIVQTGGLDRDMMANMQRFVDGIEEAVRKEPENWLWMHGRWRL